MSDWTLLFVLLFAGAVAAGVAFAVITIVLIRNLSRRVEFLERERAELGAARVDRAPSGGATVVPPPTTPVAPMPVQREPASMPKFSASATPARVEAVGIEPALAAVPAPSIPPPPPPRVPARSFDWERWLGVRGAAVVGGIVLAIAGFLFLQYSIERQWIGPEVRVAVAALVGVALIVGASPLRRRGYVVVADSITGTGAVLLYASAWAAQMYGWIGYLPAFMAMAGVTVACAYLAHRHGSLVTAVIGLVGGFTTPLVLSTGENRPIALFGYVLLLDLGFLFVADRRKWPSLGLVALGGTFVVQALWIFLRMGREDLPIALVVLAVFAWLFVLFVARIAAPARARWGSAQVGALLLPFAFAVYFAQDRALSEDVWPLFVLAGLLTSGAAWTARSSELAWLPVGTASGAVALAFTWTANRQYVLTGEQAVELLASGLALVALHATLLELVRRRPSAGRITAVLRAEVVVAVGLQMIVLFAASRPLALAPELWFVTSSISALAVYHAVGRGCAPPAAFGAGLLVGATTIAWVLRPLPAGLAIGSHVQWFWLVFIGSALLFAGWLVRHRGSVWPYHALLGFSVPASLALLTLASSFHVEVPTHAAIAAVLAVQGALAATTTRSSASLACVLVTATIVEFMVGSQMSSLRSGSGFSATFTLVCVLGGVLAVWPLFRARAWIDRPNAWRFAAGSLLPLFFIVRWMFRERGLDAPLFTLPIAFELVAGLVAARLYATRATEDRARRVGRIWFTCAAILFAAMIVPLQVDREPFALTLALFSAGIALFHVRVDARPLAWVAAGAVVVATIVLDLVRIQSSFEHSATRVWNWLAYTHLGPGIAAAFAATFLRRAGAKVPAAIVGACALLSIFTWLNLEIADAFASGERFTLRYEHTQTRDLTVSLAWVVYALVLLVLGVTRRRTGLRWASLVLLLVTIGKVFLFDLGHLQGLHRAASVAGLGVTLLLVSILYQRFVFRRAPSAT